MVARLTSKSLRLVPWTITDALLALVVEFALVSILLAVADNLLRWYGRPDIFTLVEGSPWWVFLVFLVQNTLLLGVLWLFCWRRYHPTAAKLGFRRTALKPAAGLITLVFFFNLAIVYAYNALSSYHNFQLPGFGEQEPHLPLFGNSSAGLILLAIVAIFIAPILEELFFRGFLQQALAQKMGSGKGLVTASLLFALAHFELQVIIPIFILSLLLGWLFVRTNSLWPGIIFHAINNSLALVVEFVVLNSI